MSTTVLQQILSAERQMEDSIEGAKNKAERMIRDAEIYTRETTEKKKESLLKERQESLEEAQKKLEHERKKKAEGAKKAVAEMTKKAEKNSADAIEYVYREFLRAVEDHD